MRNVSSVDINDPYMPQEGKLTIRQSLFVKEKENYRVKSLPISTGRESFMPTNEN